MYEHLDNRFILGVDVGGSHITAALVNAGSGTILSDTVTRSRIDNAGEKDIILQQWVSALRAALSGKPIASLAGIGIAIPGPFDYEKGICLMKGVNKYDSLYGVHVSAYLRKELNLAESFPLIFENDASCFGLGESLCADALEFKNIIAVTLGTGFGATFLENRIIKKSGEGVPPHGHLYNVPYQQGIAEDYVSGAWIIKTYNNISGESLTEVLDIANKALYQNEDIALQVFEQFGQHLAACLLPWIKSFNAQCLVIGGSISKSADLFIKPLQEALSNENINLVLKTMTRMELSAITGAASLVKQQLNTASNQQNISWRKTSQPLMPVTNKGLDTESSKYNMYPFYNIGPEDIFSGYDTLATWMATQKTVMIDGYGGNDWLCIRAALADYFSKEQVRVNWIEMSAFEKPASIVNEMVAPFLGEKEAVWGKRTSLSLIDLYEAEELTEVKPDSSFDLNIIIGTGAALVNWESLVYVDLPKNEIQYRMRAGDITNLGNDVTESPSAMYKRFYFVDWVLLNRHRRNIAGKIMVMADGQWKNTINWAFFTAVEKGLSQMANDVIRARPWFEAGTWGGQWLKTNIEQINKTEVNYAWSFELIVPENGLVLESENNLLEVSFDWLMELQTNAVLGKDAARFGTEFPIRFDFLDTFDGGNLSIQCHPSLPYIQEHFGEKITQDETYYIMDCKDDARVYLGFQEDIDPQQFREALETSFREDTAIDIEKYVQSFPSHKHDLFLIPNKTIHSSAANNMVLEISATPYIFTFKMYDWVRMDLDNKPRPININHAFKNLNFERKGKRVEEELISKSAVLEAKDDWKIINLPTHEDHFYGVHRLEFANQMNVKTNGQCHVMMLVEGESIMVKTTTGKAKLFSYGETFIIPASAGAYELTNNGKTMARVIKAFIK